MEVPLRRWEHLPCCAEAGYRLPFHWAPWSYVPGLSGLSVNYVACRNAADGAVEEPAGADPDVRNLLASDELDLLERDQRGDRGRALSGRLKTGRRSDEEDPALCRSLREALRPYAVLLRLHRL